MVVTGCKKMDSTYEQFIVPGGIIYAGKANKAVVQSGKNRVRISWPRGTDPNVTRAGIYWNNFRDSIELSIPVTGDSISQVISNLEEKSYSFTIYTYDNQGHVSVPVELISAAYGEIYQNSLLNRIANVNKVNAAGNVVSINWAGADITNGAFMTEVLYTNTAGAESVKKVLSKETVTTINDYKPGTRYEYRTLYRPDSLSIDVFNTAYSQGQDFAFDKSEWKITAFSTQHPGADNAVKNAIDGTDATRWHSLAGGSSYPHFMTVDLGGEKTISRFGVWRTTFETGGDNRAPNRIQFLVSMDNVTWTDLGIYDFNRMINGEQVYNIPSKPLARYFKFVAVSGPENNMVLGEISAYGL